MFSAYSYCISAVTVFYVTSCYMSEILPLSPVCPAK